MKIIIYLSYLFFISEFVLMLVKRSKKSTVKQRGDKGSLILLWVMITFCFTFGFIFSNYSKWNSNNYTIAGFGMFIILVGVIIRWASIIQLKKAFTVDVSIGNEQELKTNGMYKLIRHPSYLGLFMIMLGFSVCMNSLMSVLIVAIPMFLVILYRIIVEERILINEFGESYLKYKSSTKRLIPFVF